MFLTSAQFQAIVPQAPGSRITTFLGPINDTLTKYDISSSQVAAMFLAQIMHESAGCLYTTELASGQAYEGRAALYRSQDAPITQQ
jgi:putative chitinase